MNISLLLYLLIFHRFFSKGIALLKDKDNFVTGIEHPDAKGKVTPVDYINSDHIDSVDEYGEFSFWSNSFLTIKPGKRIRFPKGVKNSSIELNTVGDTFLILATINNDVTSVKLAAIDSMQQVYICIRAYTKGDKFYGELSLRRPDRGLVAEQIFETAFVGRQKKFTKNEYGGFVADWNFSQKSILKVFNDKAQVTFFSPSKFVAKTLCFSKQFEGDLKVRYELGGLTFYPSKSSYI